MLCALDDDRSGSTSLPPERASSSSLFLSGLRSPENEPLAKATDFRTGARWFDPGDTKVGRPRGAGDTLPLDVMALE